MADPPAPPIPKQEEKAPGQANASVSQTNKGPGQANASTKPFGTVKGFSSTGSIESDKKPGDVNTQAIFDSVAVIPNTAYLLWTEYATDFLKEKLAECAKIVSIEEKYLLCISLWVLCALSGASSSIFIVLISTAVPGIESLKAIESGKPELVRRWLKYWVVFGIVNAIEFVIPSVLARALSLSFMKGFLLLWCVLPIEPNGTEVVYRRLMSSRARGDIEATARLLDTYLGALRKRSISKDAVTKDVAVRCVAASLAASMKQVDFSLSALGPIETATPAAQLIGAPPGFELILPEKERPIAAEHHRKPTMVATGAGVAMNEEAVSDADPEQAAGRHAAGRKAKDSS